MYVDTCKVNPEMIPLTPVPSVLDMEVAEIMYVLDDTQASCAQAVPHMTNGQLRHQSCR